MHRLPPEDLLRVRPLFDVPHLALVLDAMAAGNSPGIVWVDDPAQPRVVLAWDKTHSVYLAGDASAPDAELARFIRDEWLNLVRPLGLFKIYVGHDAWLAKTGDLFPGVTLADRARVFFGGLEEGIPEWREKMPAGFHMRAIDSEFLAQTHLKNHDDLIEEIDSCWPSMAHFYTDGFGFCLVTDTGEIVSRCTAEYVSEGKCGIGIATMEGYQRRGFATLTASAFVEESMRRSLLPHWDSWLNNTPSVAVAEKIGLHKVGEYAVRLARFEDT